jgi:hypothetical protein
MSGERSKLLGLWVTPEEHAQLTELAGKRGMAAGYRYASPTSEAYRLLATCLSELRSAGASAGKGSPRRASKKARARARSLAARRRGASKRSRASKKRK